ncbi:hypothetical protein M427DRAFT_52219 [Gonapodya prolifera JEL478]|uniref:Uncharacterized protein n=1 Tax=Gonapodya prolifera (strain JEL478) TaxID=1344416 RepID=A0A139AV75_GONPJ|nr:hypothetical protein M427DRAFT_52219 [Gonapodya prolifera JEL478]|eukprot:KXS20632.1 hypothetical protein M427DRAFT_52219 [Gonapodya prolifera JEL478]
MRIYCAASERAVAATLRSLPRVEKVGYLTPSQSDWAVLKHGSGAAALNPGGRSLVLAHLRKLGLRWFQTSVASLKEMCGLASRGMPNLETLELVFGSMQHDELGECPARSVSPCKVLGWEVEDGGRKGCSG